MEHVYTVYRKPVQGKPHYFVKKLLRLAELNGLDDILVGFGMHTDFHKACSIAGITDPACRENLLTELEKRSASIQPVPQQKPIADPVANWLAGLGVEVMN